MAARVWAIDLGPFRAIDCLVACDELTWRKVFLSQAPDAGAHGPWIPGPGCASVWGNQEEQLLCVCLDPAIIRRADKAWAATVVAHEASHVATFLNRWMEPNEEFSNETRAYLTGLVAGECWRAMEAHHARRKPKK